MQLTIDIPENVAQAYQHRAEEQGRSMAELVEEALMRLMPEQPPSEEESNIPVGPEIRHDGPLGFPRIVPRETSPFPLNLENLNDFIFSD